ncbi:MAG: SIR2 family protein [Erysipelotrichaceae bacterium]|nr:SIR2 family protein [Erysipelotrichaceae bacterium]
MLKKNKNSNNKKRLNNKREKPVCLLIGNGFNRINNPDFPSWDNLILNLFDKYELNKNDYDIKTTSYPLKFEYIVNVINEERNSWHEHTYKECKEKIIEDLDKSITDKKNLDKEIIEGLRDCKPDYIITTNYDTLLEKAFAYRSSYKYGSRLDKTHANDKKLNNRERGREVYLNKTARFSKRNVIFYHMHGINVDIKSICLGYEHYMRIIKKLRDVIVKNERDPEILNLLKTGEHKNMSNYFCTRFFDSDIHIIGLGLEEQEIDIWWLLCYRAYLYFSNINNARNLIKNKIIYHDVHVTKSTNEGYSFEDDYQKQKEMLFKYLYVEYDAINIENVNQYKDKYVEILKGIK